MHVEPSDDRPSQPRRHHTSRVPGDRSLTVAHGRYLLFDWPAARLLPARAYDAVRHGGPTTFTGRQTARSTGRSCHLRRPARSAVRASAPVAVGAEAEVRNPPRRAGQVAPSSWMRKPDRVRRRFSIGGALAASAASTRARNWREAGRSSAGVAAESCFLVSTRLPDP